MFNCFFFTCKKSLDLQMQCTNAYLLITAAQQIDVIFLEYTCMKPREQAYLFQ